MSNSGVFGTWSMAEGLGGGEEGDIAPPILVCSHIFMIYIYFPTIFIKFVRITYEVIKCHQVGGYGHPCRLPAPGEGRADNMFFTICYPAWR